MSITQCILDELERRFPKTATNREIGELFSIASHRASGRLANLGRKGKIICTAKGHSGKASEWKALRGRAIDPQRIAKIERNYAFIIALTTALDSLENEALYASAEKQLGLRRACAQIREVMDQHVE